MSFRPSHILDSQVLFKLAVDRCILKGVYPSGAAIHRELGRPEWVAKKCNLNGRECRWRREQCALRGFRLKGKNLENQGPNLLEQLLSRS